MYRDFIVTRFLVYATDVDTHTKTSYMTLSYVSLHTNIHHVTSANLVSQIQTTSKPHPSTKPHPQSCPNNPSTKLLPLPLTLPPQPRSMHLPPNIKQSIINLPLLLAP